MLALTYISLYVKIFTLVNDIFYVIEGDPPVKPYPEIQNTVTQCDGGITVHTNAAIKHGTTKKVIISFYF